MKTDDLINVLTADRLRQPTRLGLLWSLAIAGAFVFAFAVFMATLGPRADLADAVGSLRFVFKFVLVATLAVAGLAVVTRLARPGEHAPMWLLIVAPVLALAAVVLELVALPASGWAMAATGKNAAICLTFIPLIGAGPLAAFLLVLRRGAPTRPALAGAVAGLAAGGMGAFFYAAHCTDDSPLFVAIHYSLAIAMLAAIGGLLGARILRW